MAKSGGEASLADRHGRVIIVGYEDPIKKILATALRTRFASKADHVTDIVVRAACPSGEALLTEFTRNVRNEHLPGLIILEINMPVMNGINTALCLRSLERGANISEKTPILFFTNRELDETFRKVIRFVEPAKFLPIGDINKAAFTEKAAQVSDLLAKEDW